MSDRNPTRRGLHAPEREARQRIHAAAAASAALDDGRWIPTPEILAALAELIEAAAGWAMVAELEAA